MQTNVGQGKLLARIRKLTDKIIDLQGKFNLPKANPERFSTYGGAIELQKARVERSGAQSQLDPLRIVAKGISCRDCAFFADLDSPTCWRFGLAKCTAHERSHAGDCGPDAELFVAA